MYGCVGFEPISYNLLYFIFPIGLSSKTLQLYISIHKIVISMVIEFDNLLCKPK